MRALEAARATGRKVYVHCTAGLGRSPAVAIAALFWFTHLQLDEAYAFLTGIRPCGPNKDAIRGGELGWVRDGRCGWAGLRWAGVHGVRGVSRAVHPPACTQQCWPAGDGARACFLASLPPRP